MYFGEVSLAMAARERSIMISYKSDNRLTADELYRELEAAGLSPWMDRLGIEEGAMWRDELLEELRQCSALVALLSRGYVESEHCRMEMLIARSRGCVVLPIALEDCFHLLDTYEETKGLADTFMVRLYRLSVVGFPITRQEAFRRVITAARSIGQESASKTVYVAYCNNEAATATRIAHRLEQGGISAWVATRDCRVGDNWREAQARGILNASIQIVVLDESIAQQEVLRTEIVLGEAFGLPVFTVLGENLAANADALARVMKHLRAADITYRRLTERQPFRSDEHSVMKLVDRIRATMDHSPSGVAGRS